MVLGRASAILSSWMGLRLMGWRPAFLGDIFLRRGTSQYPYILPTILLLSQVALPTKVIINFIRTVQLSHNREGETRKNYLRVQSVEQGCVYAEAYTDSIGFGSRESLH